MKKNSKLIISMSLFLMVLLSACSSKIEVKEEVKKIETKKVTDMKGEVKIPIDPKRIVDVSGSADDLIVLGVPFIASANTSMFDGVTVADYLEEYFTENKIETVGNYSGATAAGDLNLEKIAELKPDIIIMNIRHQKVYDQLKAIAPTLMIDDDISYVNWRGRFKQIATWFEKEEIANQWLKEYDLKGEELSKEIKKIVGDETFAVVEANSVNFGSYYVYGTGGPGELIFDALKLPSSSGTPKDVWGEIVDSEYFSKIDADHIFFFSDDGKLGETENIPTWKNLKAVKNGNVYLGVNNLQYDMAYTINGKLIYMEKLADAIINHGNVE